MRLWYWLRLVAVLAVLALCVWGGLGEGVRNLHVARTAGQRVETWAEVAYGVLGALAIVALLARSRVAMTLLVPWAVAVTTAAALAPAVWGGTGAGPSAWAGAGAAVVAALVLLGARAHLRAPRRRSADAGA